MVEFSPRRSRRWRRLFICDGAVSSAHPSQSKVESQIPDLVSFPEAVALCTPPFRGADEDVSFHCREGVQGSDRRHVSFKKTPSVTSTRRRRSVNIVGRRRQKVWICSGCKKVKCVPMDFSEWLRNRKNMKRRACARCNDCKARAKKEEEVQRMKSLALVVMTSDNYGFLTESQVLQNDML